MVTRQQAENGQWRVLDLSGTAFTVSIDLMLRNPKVNDVVLVAGKRSRKFARELDALRRLREAGVASPD